MGPTTPSGDGAAKGKAQRKRLLAYGAALVVVLLAGWLWGVQTIREEIFPYRIVQLLRGEREPAAPQQPAEVAAPRPEKVRFGIARAQEIQADVEARGAALLDDLRSRLIAPAELVTLDSADTPDRGREITASYYGLTVRGYLGEAAGSGDCLIVYSQGHGGDPFKFAYHNELRQAALDRGCDVLSLAMIGRGPNEGPASFPSTINGSDDMQIGTKEAREHGYFYSFFDRDHPQLDPLALFLSGNFHIIQSVAANYDHVSMIGISGGGWQTTLLAALMPRVDISVSYAGTVPLFLRTDKKTLGDYEQVFAPLWRDYDYFHFYFLAGVGAAEGRRREVYLVYNDKDRCCFSDPTASEMKQIFEAVEGVTVLVRESDEHAIDVELAKGLILPD